MAVLATLGTLLAGCAGGATFAERPGFREYFDAWPPNPSGPTATEQALLTRYRPRLFVPADSEGPISFYRDYIAAGVLRDAGGKTISESVSQATLNEWRDDARVTFVHTGRHGDRVHPEALGRVEYREFPGLGRLTFLTWHFVFRTSGLPDGLSGIRRFAMALVGDLVDWHQLDHYTAATLVLSDDGKPFAMWLQQHNYQRSYILGCDAPALTDDRMRIVAAVGSNELYPWSADVTPWRAVSFISRKNLEWLVLGEKKPTMTADDIADPGREVAYELAALPGTDAFYQFRGSLGKKRLLPGRSGPPGADYDTFPAIKDLNFKLAAMNWVEGDTEMMDRIASVVEGTMANGRVEPAAKEWFRARFVKRLNAPCSVYRPR